MHIRNLSVLSYAQGYTAWHYRGEALPLAEDFFSPAYDMMQQGDTIMVSTQSGGALLFLQTVDKVAGTSRTVIMAYTTPSSQELPNA